MNNNVHYALQLFKNNNLFDTYGNTHDKNDREDDLVVHFDIF